MHGGRSTAAKMLMHVTQFDSAACLGTSALRGGTGEDTCHMPTADEKTPLCKLPERNRMDSLVKDGQRKR